MHMRSAADDGASPLPPARHGFEPLGSPEPGRLPNTITTSKIKSARGTLAIGIQPAS